MRIGLLIYSIGIVMIIHWNWDTLFSNKPIWAVFSVLWTLVVRCFRMGLYYPNSSGLSQVVSWETYPTTRRIRDAISGFEHCSEKSSCQDLSSTQIFDALVAGTIGDETMGTIVESRPKLFGREALRWAIRWSWFSPGESPSDDQINGLFGSGIVPVLGLKQHKMTPAVSEKRHHWMVDSSCRYIHHEPQWWLVWTNLNSSPLPGSVAQKHSHFSMVRIFMRDILCFKTILIDGLSEKVETTSKSHVLLLFSPWKLPLDL